MTQQNKARFAAPLVSVVIPTKNRPELLARALASVVSQQCDYPVEILVVDDASSDIAGAVVQRFQMSHGDRMLIACHRNGLPAGGIGARLTGVSLAKGKYIAFLDDDDAWLPTKLQQQLIVLESNPSVGGVSCWFLVQMEGVSYPRRIVKPLSLRELLSANLLGSFSLCMVRAEIARKIGARLDSSLPSHQDWFFWLEVFRAGYDIEVVKEPLVIQFLHQGERISKNYRNCVIGRERFLATYGELLDEKQRTKHLLALELLRIKQEDNIAAKFYFFKRACKHSWMRSCVYFFYDVFVSLFPYRDRVMRKKNMFLARLRNLPGVNRFIDKLLP